MRHILLLLLLLTPTVARAQLSTTCTSGNTIAIDTSTKTYKCVTAGNYLVYKVSGVNLNSGNNTDITSLTNLPSKYVVRRITITNASTSLTLATVAVFTGAGGTGTTIVATAALAALTGATKFTDLTIALSADTTTAATLFLRQIVTQGGAATADFYIEVEPLP